MSKLKPPSIEILCPNCDYWDRKDTRQDQTEYPSAANAHWCLHPLNTNYKTKVDPRTNCSHWKLSRFQILDRCFTCIHSYVEGSENTVRAWCNRRVQGLQGLIVRECIEHTHYSNQAIARDLCLELWSTVYAHKIAVPDTTPEQATRCADTAISKFTTIAGVL